MGSSLVRNSYTIDSVGVSSLTVYYVGYEQCKPGHSWGPGIRDHYLLHHVRSGSGIYQVGEEVYHVKAGDTFLARPGNTIFYEADQQDPWSYCWIGFHGSECADLLAQTDFSVSGHVIHTYFGSELSDILLNIYDMRGSTLADTLQMTGGLYQLMSCLIRNSKNSARESFYKEVSIHQVAEYVSSHISLNFTIRDLAKHANMSQSGLYRAFMEQIGVSPMKYVEGQRMKRACALLRSTDMPVLGVACSVGFSNAQYFSRYFKKYMGISPSEYVLLSRTAPEKLPVAPFIPEVP